MAQAAACRWWPMARSRSWCRRSGARRLIARIVYTGPVPAPVTEGTPIGNLKVWRNDNLILTMPLKAAENIGKGNMPQRAFDAVTEMIIALFRAGAERL